MSLQGVKDEVKDTGIGVEYHRLDIETITLSTKFGPKEKVPEYPSGQGFYKNHYESPCGPKSLAVASLLTLQRDNHGHYKWHVADSQSGWTKTITSIMIFAVSLIATLVSLGFVSGTSKDAVGGITNQALSSPDGSWTLEGFKSLVTFGDSFTDEARALYFQSHNWQPPPPGWREPVNAQTSTGGYIWPRYVNWYTGANTYNYAVSGAVCSKKITPRASTVQGIQQYEMSGFFADRNFTRNGTPFLHLPQLSTVFAVWIGTNDLGAGGFMTNNEITNMTLTDYVDCVFDVFDGLYQKGARRFVLLNVIPLDLTPMYAPANKGGLTYSQFWPGPKPSNLTKISINMRNMVEDVNEEFKNRTTATALNKQTYPDAQLALFDVWSLFNTIYNNPTSYLNGTLPANVTGSQVQCSGSYGNLRCWATLSPDSYLWRDELHPSEQAGRVLAKEFLNVVSGTSQYATYFS